MRLLTRNTIVYLTAAICVFLLGGFVFYQQLNTIISEEATENLLLKKKQIVAFVDANQKLPDDILQTETVSFTPAKSLVKDTIRDTSVFNDLEKELLPYRQLTFGIGLQGRFYEVHVSKPMFESEDLVEAITFTLSIISVALLVTMLTVNYIFSRRTWKPFFKTVDALQAYDIEQHQAIVAEPTNIVEFRQLNEAIRKMTAKISADFRNLKTFTENASHEIQTPLAIIKAKLELLAQSERHNEEDMLAIQSMYDAASRLSKLNQALLLLTKIENQQFTQKEPVDLGKLLGRHIDNYSELIEARQITLQTSIAEGITRQSNPALMDILFTNLLTNAIRHNQTGGSISVTLSAHQLIISNTGAPPRDQPAELFERFRKGSHSDSLGLGLSIVQKISDAEGLSIQYDYADGYHTIRIEF